jgi:hypothetical protein
MILYRPVGMNELRLMYDAEMRAFPPRLPDQPIFYPVLNFEYADQIAREWNTKTQPHAGYVTKFVVDDEHASRFPAQQVGGRQHVELWIPTEDLAEFNRHIASPIKVVAAHFGPAFRGFIPDAFGLRGKDAAQQFVSLAGTLDYSAMDFHCEVTANRTAMYLNFAFWAQSDFVDHGIDQHQRDHVVAAVRNVWAGAFPDMPLPLTN